MKVNDLMIGDWVLWCDINPNIDGSNDLCFNPHKITMDDFVWFYQNDYEESEELAFDKPIPLTEEILKVNGFEYKVSVRGYVYDESDEDYSKYDFVIRHFRDLYFIPVLYSRVIDVHSVHELQHALRLCGFGELADNFKIE